MHHLHGQYIPPCFDDNDVLFKRILNHFHSASHLLCEEKKIIIKEVFKIDKKSETDSAERNLQIGEEKKESREERKTGQTTISILPK